MPNEALLPVSVVYGFLLVLARVSGALVFVPIPGANRSPEPARAVLILAFTIALMPLWPKIDAAPGLGLFTGWMLAEAAFGLSVGLIITFLSEAFLLCGQMVGLQAGYSYASIVDPNTQSDSNVLTTLAQLMASLLFFAFGFHREVLRIFARSLETLPPGAFLLTPATAEAFLRLGGGIFTTGLRLALPVVALLLTVDLALALLGRINSQLQLLTLAFPAKMLAALALLAVAVSIFPRVFRGYGDRLFEALPALLR
jgi:flagellar biosynthetic protein FliR